jgi:hypothetical protein
VCLNSITVRSGNTIQSIAFSYSDKDGNQHDTGAWGAHVGHHVVASFHTVSTNNLFNTAKP